MITIDRRVFSQRSLEIRNCLMIVAARLNYFWNCILWTVGERLFYCATEKVSYFWDCILEFGCEHLFYCATENFITGHNLLCGVG